MLITLLSNKELKKLKKSFLISKIESLKFKSGEKKLFQFKESFNKSRKSDKLYKKLSIELLKSLKFMKSKKSLRKELMFLKSFKLKK